MKKLILLFIFILFMSACSTDVPSEQVTSEETFLEEVITTDLDIPWNLNKVENTFYVSERSGIIIEIHGSNGLKIDQTINVTKEILHEGEGGLLGFIVAPDFEQSKVAFAYHTYTQSGLVLNRIIALELEENTWKEVAVLLEEIPGGRTHNGGRIAIGPDGKLYATTGDAGQPDYSQDTENLAGKILRMELDGTIPNDNPFDYSYVYSYGHRNPQGLAWDENGTLYSSEHGPTGHDEINLIEPGNNYGWPIIKGDQQETNMVTPLFHSGDETWAPSGIAIKDNKIYVANLRGLHIRMFNLTDRTESIFYEYGGRLRDVLIEENTLYTITNNRDGRGTPQDDDDKLIKIKLSE
uniref:Quinoprotein glucose dehydrogenase n=1 Tax=Anaerobacillus isosaccharinicus TaxID=1532552 RepID=A0A1S2KXA5_9BACI|nr:PQQ-dependent sugar dehydrogenase [Anaerobacillus isosaccharinicus]QOY34917.1 PQQ-dependent sugar dehydrogenase [Anaerobacillus isosaccharinicus]